MLLPVISCTALKIRNKLSLYISLSVCKNRISIKSLSGLSVVKDRDNLSNTIQRNTTQFKTTQYHSIQYMYNIIPFSVLQV